MIYMLIASFCFALTGACARFLSPDINAIELVLFRNIIGVVFIVYSIFKKPLIQTGGRPFLLVFRGLIGTLALYSFFYGIAHIGLAVAITYQQSYPVFLALIAALFMGERLNRNEWFAIIIGFAGVALIFFPSIDTSSLSFKHHLIGLSNAVMTGMAYLSIRGLSKFYDHRSIILSFMLSGLILPIVSLSIGQYREAAHLDFMIDKFVWPQGWQYGVILLLGMAALIGQIYLTKAFSFHKTGIIAAVGYSNILFSIFFGVALGDAFPGPLSFLGISFVFVCGILISFAKQKMKQVQT